MKPKPLYGTIKTRDDGGETATAVDSRFPLFYDNVDTEVYSIIGDGDKNTWRYDDDKYNTSIHHLPAENTVFINANIALTDGSCKKFNIEGKTPRTIPNLYDALTALATKISDIHNQINNLYSTADKYLHVIKNNNSVTISPGKNETGVIANAVDKDINRVKITSGKDTTSIAITDKDIEFTIKPNDEDSRTYTLGAIIEAIQELNRRTAYMDSTMSFSDAKNHLDVNDGDSVSGAHYQTEDDELPAATDNHYNEHLSTNKTRSISNGKLSRMKIIMYDPETDRIVDNTGKDIPFTREISMLNDNPLLDDPTVISPESVAIRMRGCPYLLQ